MYKSSRKDGLSLYMNIDGSIIAAIYTYYNPIKLSVDSTELL